MVNLDQLTEISFKGYQTLDPQINVQINKRTRNGKILETREAHNRVTKLALMGFIRFINGEFNDTTREDLKTYQPKYLALGGNRASSNGGIVTSSVNVNDPRLLDEITYNGLPARILLTQRNIVENYESNNFIKLTIKCYVPENAFIGERIGEAGLFTDKKGANCWARVAFEPFDKNDGEVIDITWEIVVLSVGDTKYVSRIDLFNGDFPCKEYTFYKLDQRLLLRAEFYPPDATVKNILYTSDNENVAVVDPDSGTVLPVANGSCNVIATTTNGIFAYVKIKVDADELAGSVGSVFVSDLQICMDGKPIREHLFTALDESTRFTVNYLPTNATLGRSVTWSSSNDGIAYIDPRTGQLKPVSNGIVNITATTSNNVTGTVKVTVNTTGISTDIDPDDPFNIFDDQLNNPLNNQIIFIGADSSNIKAGFDLLVLDGNFNKYDLIENNRVLNCNFINASATTDPDKEDIDPEAIIIVGAIPSEMLNDLTTVFDSETSLTLDKINHIYDGNFIKLSGTGAATSDDPFLKFKPEEGSERSDYVFIGIKRKDLQDSDYLLLTSPSILPKENGSVLNADPSMYKIIRTDENGNVM